MERRRVVVGLGLALGAVVPARADESAAPMGDAERRHLQRTRTAGALSLALSRVAAKKGDDDDVKEFVQFEITEQETLADILIGLGGDGPASGRVKSPDDQSVAALLDAGAGEALRTLDAQKPGLPFDQDFIRRQIDVHGRLMEIQMDYLAVGRSFPSLAVAKLARVAIKEHLTLLSDIDAALGRG